MPQEVGPWHPTARQAGDRSFFRGREGSERDWTLAFAAASRFRERVAVYLHRGCRPHRQPHLVLTRVTPVNTDGCIASLSEAFQLLRCAFRRRTDMLGFPYILALASVQTWLGPFRHRIAQNRQPGPSEGKPWQKNKAPRHRRPGWKRTKQTNIDASYQCL